MRRTNRARSDATRSALVTAARRLFVEASYAGTGTPQVAAEAGVTRGALYHHFADKQALFRAVVEAESAAVAAEIERAAPAELPPVQALIAGGDAFLAAMAIPGRTRLLLIDGPSVLGREELDEIDARHGGRTLREGLAAATEAGAMARMPLVPAAQLLGAAFDRAALAIGQGADPEDWRSVLKAVIMGLLRPTEGARALRAGEK